MKRVLIVDDEAALVRSIAKYLDSFPGEYRVFSATSGEEGLGILRNQAVDVLLTDVNMPGLDGIEVMRRALEMRPKIRIIVMTAFGSPELQALALRAGAMRFVNKPLDLDDLRGIIQMSALVETGWAGMVGGLDLLDLAQLIALAGKTAVVHVGCGDEVGILVFQERQVTHASQGLLQGEEAFYRIALWSGGTFQEDTGADLARYPKNVEAKATQLFLEAAHRRDEEAQRRAEEASMVGLGTPSEASAEPAPPGLPAPTGGETGWPEATCTRIEQMLAEAEGVGGFLGAAVVSPTNRLLVKQSRSDLDITGIAATAYQALAALREASTRMGLGRTDLAFLRAPRATCFLRRLDEHVTGGAPEGATELSFTVILLIAPDANAGMAKILVDKLAGRIAEAVRT